MLKGAEITKKLVQKHNFENCYLREHKQTTKLKQSSKNGETRRERKIGGAANPVISSCYRSQPPPKIPFKTHFLLWSTELLIVPSYSSNHHTPYRSDSPPSCLPSIRISDPQEDTNGERDMTAKRKHIPRSRPPKIRIWVIAAVEPPLSRNW